MINIRHARIDERFKTFKWYCDIFEKNDNLDESIIQKYTYEEYLEDFRDVYFDPLRQSYGSVMIIQNDDEEIGCMCYACFHLHSNSAELDIWLKDEATCGMGFGTGALKQLIKYLIKKKGIRFFLIRPSEQNIRAISSYKKAGFLVADDKKEAISKYLKPQYIEEYGDGDYGFNDTAVMVLENI